mgnify:CR=1 FL=1
MGMTMTQKILAAHAGLDRVAAGQLIEAKLDVVMANDITGPMAVPVFRQMADKVFDKDKVVLVPDHFTPNKDIKSAENSKSIREFAVRIEHYGDVGLIAIPTTSGTGSEVTSFAVVSDPAEQRKYPLVSRDLTPDEAILDAELVKSVPPAVTADTGMDVFTHALEACVSTDRNDFATALAEKAIEICGVFLLRAYLDGSDTHARQKMHSASCLAGLAFNSASLGLNHGMAHQLGATFHIPHGRANAMLLPHIIEFNSDINKHSKSQAKYLPAVERYKTVARILGLSSYNTIMTVRNLVNWVQFMLKEMDIPLSVSQMGKISKEEYFAEIERMAEAALADGCTATNPRVPSKADVMKIYESLW